MLAIRPCREFHRRAALRRSALAIPTRQILYLIYSGYNGDSAPQHAAGAGRQRPKESGQPVVHVSGIWINIGRRQEGRRDMYGRCGNGREQRH
jgi:hypothetical protein